MKQLWINLGKIFFLLNAIFVGIYVSAYDTHDFFLLAEVCKGNEILICDKEYKKTQESIDLHILYLHELISTFTPKQKERLFLKSQKIINILSLKENQEEDILSFFKLQYTRFHLQSRINDYKIKQKGIFIPYTITSRIFKENKNHDIFVKYLRRSIIEKLIEKGFSHFSTRPYIGKERYISTTNYRENYQVNKDIYLQDTIDNQVQNYIRYLQDGKKKDFFVPEKVRQHWKGIQFFKNTEDLRSLGYQVVSHRKRINKDAEYRRFNIAKAFELIGHVKVLNPGETFSYLKDSHFDVQEKNLYMTGKSIFLDEIVEDYGGGLCGGSTAIYQGVFLNTALDIGSRNHSKRYSNLYRATINGIYQTIPGMDSTVYSSSLDLHIKNTSDHPIIFVMNFDGTYGGVEEVFTLGYLTDRGSYQYQSKRNKEFTINVKNKKTKKLRKKTVTGKCYTWEINGELIERCYKELF